MLRFKNLTRSFGQIFLIFRRETRFQARKNVNWKLVNVYFSNIIYEEELEETMGLKSKFTFKIKYILG